MGRGVVFLLLAMIQLIGHLVSGLTDTQLLNQLKGKVDALASNEIYKPIVMDNGYLMVFRIQSEINEPAFDKFMAVGRNDDSNAFVRSLLPCGCFTTDKNKPCDRHFRSQLLDLWDYLPIEKVRVGVYKNNVEARFWEFDAKGTNFFDWFRKEKLIGSSYSDLSRNAHTNYFSLVGDAKVQRRFFINKQYNNCPHDLGWLVVKEGTNFPCSWEQTFEKLSILYSKRDTVANWSGAGQVGVADSLVISIKVPPFSNCPAK